MKSKYFLVVMFCFLLCAALSPMVYAKDSATPTVTICSVSAGQNAGASVQVNVALNNTPGLVSLTIPVSWDSSILKLTDVLYADRTLPGWCGAADKALYENKYYISWNNDIRREGNLEQNGILCTLVFELLTDMETDAVTHLTVDETDPLLSIMDFDMRDYTRGEVNGIGFVFTDGVITFRPGVTVSGTITSQGGEEEPITVQLIREGETEPADEKTVYGENAQYSFDNVEAGVYRLVIKKEKHVTREYRITVGGTP